MDISTRVLHELSLLWQCQSFNADSQGLTNPRLAPRSPEGFFLNKELKFLSERKSLCECCARCVHAPRTVHQNTVCEGTTRLVLDGLLWRTESSLIENWINQREHFNFTIPAGVALLSLHKMQQRLLLIFYPHQKPWHQKVHYVVCKSIFFFSLKKRQQMQSEAVSLSFPFLSFFSPLCLFRAWLSKMLQCCSSVGRKPDTSGFYLLSRLSQPPGVSTDLSCPLHINSFSS